MEEDGSSQPIRRLDQTEEGDIIYDDEVEEVIDLSDKEDHYMDEDDDDEGMDEDQLEPLEEDIEVPDSSVTHFASHQPTALFALASHPIDPFLVVSGGEDDLAYLWRTDTGEEVARLTGHTDSVTSVGWSYDGEYVATGGMDGRVRVWRRVKGIHRGAGPWEWAKWEFLTNLDGPDEITWLAWHPKGYVLTAGSSTGPIWMWNFPNGRFMGLFSAHTAACAAGVWVSPSDGKKLLTASAGPESLVCLWDPKSPTDPPEHKWSFIATGSSDRRYALAGGINCLAVNSAGTLALVGGQADPEEPVTSAGGLRLINLVSGTVVNSLEGGDGHDAGTSIEAVAWCDLGPNQGLWLSAGTDGKVCAWEGQNGRLRWAHSHKDAVSSLVVHPQGRLVSTAGADRTVRTWDVRTGDEVATYTGHRRVIHTVAVSPDGTSITSGGDDGMGRVFKVASPTPVVQS